VDAGHVEPLVLPAVPLPHLPADALAEVLVRRADDHAVHAVVRGRDLGRRGERVVGLLLDHRPHREPGRPQRVLDLGELRLQRRVDPGAGLVAGPQVVAERLDDVVRGDADVGGALLEEHQAGADDPSGGAVPLVLVGRGEVVAEQLVGAVDEVDVHLRTLTLTNVVRFPG
jgi:hypothetical protein